MNCRCISYNRPDLNSLADKPEVILPAPSWSNRETICVDACIADAIRMLWANDVVTRGCCCGHNRTKPSVVVECGEGAAHAVQLLKAHDGRDWEVMQWRLCVISETDEATAVPILSKPFAPVAGATIEAGEPAAAARKCAPFSSVRSRPAAAGHREPRARSRKATGAAAHPHAAK